MHCVIAHAQAFVPDTQLRYRMREVEIRDKRTWQNDTVRYRYNQMKYYVTTVLPYVNEAVILQKELDEKTATEGLSRKERRNFVRSKEALLKQRFDAEVKALNETQGVLMIKLIGRQTGVNIYDILQEYKNTWAATKWQTWALMNGFNLKKKYNPDDNIMLENIMEELDYPLPPFYRQKQILSAN